MKREKTSFSIVSPFLAWPVSVYPSRMSRRTESSIHCQIYIWSEWLGLLCCERMWNDSLAHYSIFSHTKQRTDSDTCAKWPELLHTWNTQGFYRKTVYGCIWMVERPWAIAADLACCIILTWSTPWRGASSLRINLWRPLLGPSPQTHIPNKLFCHLLWALEQ